jgi:hypothetical protein
MTNTAEQLEIEEVPSGGIGDFVMSDQAFRVLERQNAEEEYGNEGIARFEDTAGRIAAYGRFGDDQVAHVETGELIVPRRLIDQSPELKESIFQHLRAAGIEDPERYVVGDAENSINPETGLMEFGFFSKIFKGIKKVFKKIGKVLKKVAPTLLAIGLSMTGLGAIYGAALGSGIGTLIQGGNIKDALKAGLLAGATAGVFKGIQGAIDPNMTAGQAISESLANPGARFAQTGTAFKDAFTGKGGEGFFKTLARDFNPNLVLKEDLAEVYAKQGYGLTPEQSLIDEKVAEITGGTDAAGQAEVGAGTKISPEEMTNIDREIERQAGPRKGPVPEEVRMARDPVTNELFPEALDPASGLTEDAPQIFRDYLTEVRTGGFDQAGKAGQGIEQLTPSGSTWENLKEMFDFGFGENKKTFLEAGKDLFFPTTGDYAKFLPEGVTKATATKFQEEAAKRALADAGLAPGLMRRFGPAAAGLSLAAAPMGFFEVPDQEEAGLLDRDEDGRLRTGSDYVDEDPYKYRVYPTGFQPTYRPPPSVLVPYPMQQVAQGGEIFPRRTGGIMPNEGVPNEDSVKAMLMPGEFVMTTTAVRGAGDGDLKKGINNMYSVMRNLESRGRAVS